MLLLEAGPPDSNPWIHIPLGFAKTYVNPAVNWKFETEPQPQLGNRRLYLPRGKTLGGSSSINGMVYMRGNHGDYDEWRQRGCEGWDWDSVLPYFKKAENQTHGADEFHGVGGPLHVSDQPDGFELADAVLEACVQAGIPRNPDFNGAQQEGLRLLPDHHAATGAAGARRRPICNPRAQRANLVVQTGAHATRVLIENNRAVGVEYQTAQGRRTARARGEVIVSGGAYGSPQLAAAVGSRSGAASAGHRCPGGARHAGGRLQPARPFQLLRQLAVQQGDHAERPGEQSAAQDSRPASRYALFRSGPMASNGIHCGLFTRSDPRLERPDVQINVFEWSTLERSQGTRRAASVSRLHAEPGASASRRPRHGAPGERRSAGAARGAVRLPAHRLRHAGGNLRHPACAARSPSSRRCKPYIVHELPPGPSITADADLAALYSAQSGVSNQHPTSSCAMGHGPNTVVDPRLRVHGIDGLRVADASIMPVAVGGNTNAPTIMIGEKAAAMILEDAMAKPTRAMPRRAAACRGKECRTTPTPTTTSSPVPGRPAACWPRGCRNPAGHRVLLLEAGGKDSNPWIHVPLGYAKTFVDPRVNWMFDSEPEPNLNNRVMYQPRGKVLGGTSSINGMIYMRGNHADYDEWRQRGCEGWDCEFRPAVFPQGRGQ